jgi:HNH endonuclease
MDVAHVARRFPVILPLLADGCLHLTAVRLLAPHLGDENHLALLAGAFRQSRREIEVLLARWFPKADVPSSVRKLPGARAKATPSEAATVKDAEAPGAVGAGVPSVSGQAEKAPPTADPRQPGIVAPLAPARYKVAFSVGEMTITKLRRAQELLSHSIPHGDLEAIFDRGLDLVIEQVSRDRCASTKRPRPGKRGESPERVGKASRSIPAEVERVVWERDGGRCAFVGVTGHRCEERHFLELHHVKPWAAGGPPTVENIALRCRAHNRYEAVRYFGPIRDARSAEM